MSKSWAKGSTRAWRQLRAEVLRRDHDSCQVVTDRTLGLRCGKPAGTVGHIIPRASGGTDTPGNLRAECATHNYGEGTRIAARMRAARTWAW